MATWTSSIISYFDARSELDYDESPLWYCFVLVFAMEVAFLATLVQGSVECTTVSEDNLNEFLLVVSDVNASMPYNITYQESSNDFSYNNEFVNVNCGREIKMYGNLFTWALLGSTVLTWTLMGYFTSYVYAVQSLARDVAAVAEAEADERKYLTKKLLKQIDRFLMFKIIVLVWYGVFNAAFYLALYLKYKVNSRAVTGAYFYHFVCGADVNYYWQQTDEPSIYRCVFSHILALNFLDWVVMLLRILLALMMIVSYYWLYDYKKRRPWEWEGEEHYGNILSLVGRALPFHRNRPKKSSRKKKLRRSRPVEKGRPPPVKDGSSVAVSQERRKAVAKQVSEHALKARTSDNAPRDTMDEMLTTAFCCGMSASLRELASAETLSAEQGRALAAYADWIECNQGDPGGGVERALAAGLERVVEEHCVALSMAVLRSPVATGLGTSLYAEDFTASDLDVTGGQSVRLRPLRAMESQPMERPAAGRPEERGGAVKGPHGAATDPAREARQAAAPASVVSSYAELMSSSWSDL